MLTRIWRFWRGLSSHWIGATGVILTTSAFVLFLLLEALRMGGVVTNSYVGLITYLSLPALFVLGLLLIPIGWWRIRRKTGRSTAELLSERFSTDLAEIRPTGRPVFALVAGFTLLNVVFLAAGSARMLQFMDSAEFCGTACHRVMNPEWTVYQGSPHARVRCVDCHVGQGVEAAFDAKLNGLWQMISVTFDLYERPIPTPVHNLRPARETCERCHWPDAFYGDRIKRIVHHAEDRASTPRHTTLSLKIGSGAGERRGEIHWHVSAKNEVRYQPADDDRANMVWVEARQPDGSVRRYTNRRLPHALAAATVAPPSAPRTMDCLDCHNRATHVYEPPDEAVDRLIAEERIDRRLPFVRRYALDALTGSYVGQDDALTAIERDLRGTYRARHPEAILGHDDAIDQAVDALTEVYQRNVHPGMNILWRPYPDHIGHHEGGGCFRCHSSELVDERGLAISHDCTLCHDILAQDSDHPFRFLLPPDPTDRDRTMHQHLRREFLDP
jgi:hypothetical protein